MESLEYSSTIVFRKDKPESWKAGKPEQILDYGGFSIDTEDFSKEDCTCIQNNIDELKDTFSALKLRDLVPVPTIGSIGMVFGWHNGTFQGEEKQWVTSDTATFAVINSIEMPIQKKVKSVDVGVELLYLDDESNPQWYSTTLQVQKINEVNLLGEGVSVKSDDVNIDDLSVFIPPDQYIADLFDVGNELKVSLSL